MFLANLFGYSGRRMMAEHAYQQTRADLRSRRGALRTQLARHGLALDDPRRTLLRRPGSAGLPGGSHAARTLRRLDEVLSDLERMLVARSRAAQPSSPAPGGR